MSYKKERRPMLFKEVTQFEDGVSLSSGVSIISTGARLKDKVQSLTGASTATEVTNYGITYIKSTGNGGAGAKVFKIAKPEAGVHKYIVGQVGSTKAISVRTLSSDNVFLLGTTKNSITFATASTYTTPVFHLVGLSTAVWAVVSPLLAQSTAVNTWRAGVAGATA